MITLNLLKTRDLGDFDGVSARWRSRESGCNWDLELSAPVKDLPLAKLGEDHIGVTIRTCRTTTQCSRRRNAAEPWSRAAFGDDRFVVLFVPSGNFLEPAGF